MFFYLGLPLLEHYLICPDIACKLCPPGEVPDFDARGCWSSCECIPATNTYSTYYHIVIYIYKHAMGVTFSVIPILWTSHPVRVVFTTSIGIHVVSV